MDDRELIRAAIDRSGLSARAFAVKVLVRDERTVRRWVSGDSPTLPHAVRNKCLAIIANMGTGPPTEEPP